MTKRMWCEWAKTLAVVALVYVALSCLSFSLRNPDNTQTENFLYIWEALTWR